jgi:hypothetical protein
MITRSENAVQPWKRITKASVIGGIALAELAALFIAATQQALVEVTLIGLIIAGMGAAAGTLAGFLVGGRKRDTLGDLEKELAKATAILERGLIEEAEFSRIKGQILEQYHYAPRANVVLWKWALWGGSAGLILPLFAMLFGYDAAMYLFITAMAGVTGGIVGGTGAAAVTFAQRKMAEHQLESGSRPMLNAK